jgi:hypothetical protein
VTEAEFQAKAATDDVKMIQPAIPPVSIPQPPNELAEFSLILQVLRKPRLHLTTAPTFVPQTFVDQIQLYDDGSARRLYLYVNKVWRYVALT